VSGEAFHPCAVVPTYDNPATVRDVVVRLRDHVEDVIVVDDGSGPDGRKAVEAIGRDGLARVIHREFNGGKGAAVKDGLAEAQARGFTHVVQVDADGQHDVSDVPRFLDAAREEPGALILGDPEFDETAPTARRLGRRITTFWIRIEAGRGVIRDALCGFRVYPVDAAVRVRGRVRGDAMDFDPEIAVRLAWAGLPVVNLRTHVRYLEREEGGVTHFRMFRDNVLISVMHARLVITKVLGAIFGGPFRRRALPG